MFKYSCESCRMGLYTSSARAESGQVVPLVALLIGLSAGATLILVHLGAAATDQARAQTAADAAALGAVFDGLQAAAELAEANGARLERLDHSDELVAASVWFGDRRATAHAAPLFPSASAGLAPPMIRAIAEAERLLGEPVPIVSGYRSRSEQQALWDARHSNPYPVAAPGSSNHERGVAIDIPSSFVGRLRQVAALVGLCQPLPVTDPVHFEMCRTTATR